MRRVASYPLAHTTTELTTMAYGHLTQMYRDGAVLNGPARPRSTRDMFVIRATVRDTRLARLRGT